MANEIRILRTRGAADYVGLSMSELEKRRRAGMDPKVVKLGARAVGYDIRDLDRFIEQRRSTRPRRRGRVA